MKQIALPDHLLIQAQEIHNPLLQPYYQPETTWKRMLRMAITPTAWISPRPTLHQSVKQLTISDLPALKNL